ncbi:hypothetical protein Ait01nite_081250 [Actinoplanes italicus]|uniref:Uncharacterized protein n=1 Tax=Actinoplanes italicus TaxID=113567 RepID=A0A2T0KK79_9ACTN|nr:hypothetical protein CLV67_103690 [Actinoplanes italicus]GIE35080.1 hypothetical protein Ait01nite_081250 [Actinoplanes italicus]
MVICGLDAPQVTTRGQPPGVASGGRSVAFVSGPEPGTTAADFGGADRDGVFAGEPGEVAAGWGSAVAADGAGGAVVDADGVTIAGPPGAGPGSRGPGDSVKLTATAAITTPAGTGNQRHSRSGGRGAATVGGTPRLSRSCVI